MPKSDHLSKQERAARARFITNYAVKRYWLPGSAVLGVLFFWFEHRPDFHWSIGLMLELILDVAIWVVLFGWIGGRMWGTHMYDTMRSKFPSWRPPEE